MSTTTTITTSSKKKGKKNSNKQQPHFNTRKSYRNSNYKFNKQHNSRDEHGPHKNDTPRTYLDRETNAQSAQAKRAIYAIALPERSYNFRWSSAFSEQKTATARPWLRKAVGFAGSGTPTNPPVPTSDCFSILRRIPQASIIAYEANSSNAAYSYTWTVFALNGFEQLGTNVTLKVPLAPTMQPVHITTAAATTPYKPNGPIIYAGSDGETARRYWWVNSNETIAGLITNGTGATATITINIWSYDEDGGAQLLTAITSGAILNGSSYSLSVLLSTILTGTNGIGTYIGLELGSSVAGDWSVNSLRVSGASALITHMAVPDLHQNIVSLGGVRMIGMSQMFSNRAANMQLQGQLATVQVSSGTCWKSFINNYSSVQSSQNSFETAAATGCYSYLKPVDPSDFDMVDYCSVKNGFVYDSKWPIAGKSDYLITYAKVTNASGQDALWSYYYNIEFRTSGNTWMVIDNATMHPDVCSNALSAVKLLDQYFENPLHLQAIIDKAKALANGVITGILKYGPRVLDGAMKYGPPIVGMAADIGSMLA